ncbi:nuclear transport factor 2 family protein [Spongiactinospora rosea]|uniref:Nuclear transport factor 2 family protein n=1 Tax=Spongiactinospora rosea TaxID=2248750 RepID=A0A366M2T7_9ACTN|nr:nuclear transport factor 2 family protein [Spongiactinospora rosea]RBQ20070.1 nuclear transport factor 2 family protein [Spongiactinospora rosea]
MTLPQRVSGGTGVSEGADGPNGTAVSGDTALYQEVQQFYARQMQLLDEGVVEGWAGTFTEDGVFTANAHPAPQRGRSTIEEGARKTAAQLEAREVRRRHWLGMLTVDERQDGTIAARTYALVLETPKGGQAGVLLSCTCDDVLVRQGGELLVQHRSVHRDDLPA